MSRVKLRGLLGKALAANHEGRLKHFITDETSAPIALFDPAHAANNRQGDWYGEHAGKWLYAAAKAAVRTDDGQLAASVRRVADYLVSVQGPDGYLGTYAPDRRFMHKQPPPRPTWDGSPSVRTWDITHLGNHHGLSATVLLDPVVELHFATQDGKYLDLAKLIVKQADERAELNLFSRALAGADAAEIGTGKSYQLTWNLVGFAKLYKATRHERYLKAATQGWESIHEHHLTLGGGPWGGVGLRSREVFNPKGVFSPYGYVETCATFSWIQLNRELLEITGDAKYAEEIERSAYNDLLGAQAPNGEDWCYYSFPNGQRVHTTYWRCCKSSGAMALEELPAAAYTPTAAGISINLYGPGEAAFTTHQAGVVTLAQETRYPLDGAIRIRVTPDRPAELTIQARIPAWARGATVEVNGTAVAQAPEPGTYVELKREWRAGDEIALAFPMEPVLHERSSRSVQESVAPDGLPVAQEVMRYDYIALTRGPLVYATGLIDGFKMEETIRIPGSSAVLEMVKPPPGFAGPAIRLTLGYREPLVFLPYYEAGGREDGTWRLTWLQRAPLSPSPRPAPPGGTR